MWFLGELARREEDLVTAESWWQRGLEASECWGCAVSTALALQQERRFLEAEQVLTAMKEVSAEAPLVTLLRGINGFYAGDRVSSLRRFRAVLQSGDETGNDDVRRIIVKQTFPAQVLAAFYAGQAASEDGRSSEAALNLARTLASWRAELLRQPSLATWADLLSAIDLHTSRTASAGAERNLVALVTQEVLEPIIRLNRAARQVQLGDLESARQELAEAARRVEDRDGRRRLQQAIEELDDWNRTQR
jgi:hypothetical protein